MTSSRSRALIAFAAAVLAVALVVAFSIVRTTAAFTDAASGNIPMAASTSQKEAPADFAPDGTCEVLYGHLYCWGLNGEGTAGVGSTNPVMTRTDVTDGTALQGLTVTSVKARSGSICALASGRLFCWGSNSNGQLGNGTASGSFVTTPTEVASALTGKTVTDFAVGRYNVCAVADGSVYCWGSGSTRIASNGVNTTDVLTPTLVGGPLAGKTATLISASEASACAIANGAPYCWGSQFGGQLGDGVDGAFGDYQPVPQAVVLSGGLAGKPISALATGMSGSCVIALETLYCWGNYDLVNCPSYCNAPTPVQVTVPGPVSSVSLSSFACARVVPGDAYCWGSDAFGTSNYTITWDPTKVTVPTTAPVSAVYAGSSSACAVAGSRTWCWGLNSSGMTGVGTGNAIRVPQRVGLPIGSSSWAAVAAGGGHACAGRTDGIWCWGQNTLGQIGQPGGSNVYTPTKVALAGPIDAVAAGASHSCATNATGAYCWGSGTSGQLGRGASTSSPSPVAVVNLPSTPTVLSAAGSVTCAVASGAAYCWGAGASGALGNGGTVNSNVPVRVDGLLAGKTVTDIEVGNAFVCAVADGAAYCWGAGASGQRGDGQTTASVTTPVAVVGLAGKTVTQVSAGSAHACAIADGDVWCWGAGAQGQLGNSASVNSLTPVKFAAPAWARPATSVAAGANRTCMTGGGVVFCAGIQTVGELGNGLTSGSISTPAGAQLFGSLTSAQFTAVDMTNSPCATGPSVVACWGDNSAGFVGAGPSRLTTPTEVWPEW